MCSSDLSAWSASTQFTTGNDVIAPGQPPAPTVAGSTISIQVTHTLGLSSGGTFNLDNDLHHLEVHVGGSDSFYPDATNMVGKIIANSGMLLGKIPVVQTFPISQIDQVFVKVIAVDNAGNKSSPSVAATVTAQLVADMYINSEIGRAHV